MTKPQRERQALILRLGNRCELVSDRCRGSLQIDHRYGRGYDLNHLSESDRIAIYLLEERHNLLRLLCAYHNRSLGGKMNSKFRKRINCYCEKCQEKKRKWNFKNKIKKILSSRVSGRC